MKFREFLSSKGVIVFDGAMGTEIYNRGASLAHCYEELNISNPFLIKEIHLEYVNAGADVITTNTFGANRFILEEYFDLGKKVKDINYYGVKIAKEVAHEKVFVAGSIGPISRPLDKEKELNEEELKRIFKEQAEILLEAGADLIILETFADPIELEIAINSVRDTYKKIVIIAEVSFPNDGLTIFGKNPYEIAEYLDHTDADIIGSNCGKGPQSVFEVIKKMAYVTKKELSAMPNAGTAQFIQNRFVYPYNPEYFAKLGKKMAEFGIKIIGGCCGTTPAHIKELKIALENVTPPKRVYREIKVSYTQPIKKEEKIISKLKEMLQVKKVIAVEINPPKDKNYKELFTKIQPYLNNIDVLNFTDSPMARARMAPLAIGKLAKDELKKEVIIHYTCRDRNILGIQSDLMGASALGLDNILALGGDPPSVGDYPFATGVYDLTSEGLVKLMASFNRGVDFLGNPIGDPTNFFIGIATGISIKNLKNDIERLKRKISLGAHFIITQPVFDIEKFIIVIKEMKMLEVPIIAGILILTSQQVAEYFHYEVPGIELSLKYLQRMEGKIGKEGEEEGKKIAYEIMHSIAHLVNGFLITIPSNKFYLLEGII